MQSYHGVVQNIVTVGDGEYRVTFRAYDERDMEATFCVNEDVPFKLFSMVARREGNVLAIIPEGILTECMCILDENETVDMVVPDEIDKWKIGFLAKDIALSLADGGMFTPFGVEGDS